MHSPSLKYFHFINYTNRCLGERVDERLDAGRTFALSCVNIDAGITVNEWPVLTRSPLAQQRITIQLRAESGPGKKRDCFPRTETVERNDYECFEMWTCKLTLRSDVFNCICQTD